MCEFLQTAYSKLCEFSLQVKERADEHAEQRSCVMMQQDPSYIKRAS